MKSFLNLSDAIHSYFNQVEVGDNVGVGIDGVATVTEVGDTIKAGQLLEWTLRGKATHRCYSNLRKPTFTKEYRFGESVLHITVKSGFIYKRWQNLPYGEFFVGNEEVTRTKQINSVIKVTHNEGGVSHETLRSTK